ncbi:hypothetical protein HMI54_011487, partial [Coelomomyces lativittatus]
ETEAEEEEEEDDSGTPSGRDGGADEEAAGQKKKEGEVPQGQKGEPQGGHLLGARASRLLREGDEGFLLPVWEGVASEAVEEHQDGPVARVRVHPIRAPQGRRDRRRNHERYVQQRDSLKG